MASLLGTTFGIVASELGASGRSRLASRIAVIGSGARKIEWAKMRKLKNIYGITRALREEGMPRAFRTAIWMEIVHPYLPHRTYLLENLEGDPGQVRCRLEWNWRKRTLYRAKHSKLLLEGED